MKVFIHLVLSLSTLFGFSQIQLSQTEFDLGEISLLNSDIIDFDVKNISNETVFLLRIAAEQNVGFQYTSKTFRNGEKEGIRIKLNPNKKGKIERKVKLYFSNNTEPIELTVKATVKVLPKNNRTACPQFGSALKPPTGKTQAVAKIQAFEVILYDDNSENQLAKTNTSILADETVTQKETEIPKQTKTTSSSNDSQFAERESSRTQSTRRTKTNPQDRRNAPSLGAILFGNSIDSTEKENEPKKKVEIVDSARNEIVIEEPQKEEVPEAEVEEVVLVADNKKSSKRTSQSNLLDESFKPNNIVFLIDASTSMRQDEKMDILKKAMIELLEPLRDIDYITIVTYSGEAKVVLPTSKGNLKEEIIKQIESLKADGSTNAVKGIKKAIQVGKANFLEDGNNQIFLASDGAFNIGENNMSLRKKIKKTAKEGLTITVLGIKNDNWTNKSLKEIADLGNGDLIKIKSMRDANKVLQSMKRKAML